MDRVTSSPERSAPDLNDRRERIQRYADDRGLEAVWFARPNGFAWLTGGDNVVDRDSPVGVAVAGYVGDDGFRVLTDTIEADRLADEEVPESFDVEVVDWYAGSLADALLERSPTPAAADFEVPGFDPVDGASLRQPLAPGDVDRYRTLGREVAASLETVCRELRSNDTEREVAAGLRIALSARGINVPVALVGGSERAQKYRHYTPTDAELGDYALVSVTAERGGLYASATRTVAFDAPDWLDERHEAAATVEASALAATRRVASEGGTAGDVFASIQAAYETVGFADEWKQHHQGGAAGFAGREWIATPTHGARVRAPMAYAWNPTIRGAKSEDTALVSDDGIEVLTDSGSWPTVEVSAVEAAGSDLTLRRPAPLER